MFWEIDDRAVAQREQAEQPPELLEGRVGHGSKHQVLIEER